ncbi:hypothetical protein F4808DRAFT_194280 [Astrocystis sublimbata]|nr:hypothetical protein F4808DRAFT_194280 [Astrocystis sublimbata]
MTTFTALNGGETKNPEGASGSPGRRQAGSEDRSAIQITSQETNSGDGSKSQAEQASRIGSERSHYQPRDYPEVEGAHKRKRSLSVERSRETPIVQSQEQRAQTESRGPYDIPSRERDYGRFGDGHREQSESWYSQQQSRDDRDLYESRDPAGPSPTQTNEPSGDRFRRAASHGDLGHDYSATSPDGDDSSMLYGGSYSQDQSRDPVIQSDPKKRKRNFSNRTKTGCLTCRKRKKKCDESKPECTNCVRGGFVCYGYPNQRGPPRMESKPAAVPLESKDPSYVPPGAYGMPQPNNYPNPPPSVVSAPGPNPASTAGPTPAQASTSAPTPAPKRDSISSYRGPYLRLETSQTRSVLTDDDRPTASSLPTASAISSVMSPDNKGSAFSAYSSAANMFPTPISAITPSTQQLKTPQHQRVPPLHDITRTDPDTTRPETPRPALLPQMNVLEPTPPAVPGHQPPPSTDPQIAAQLALSHTQYPPNSMKPRTQKEEMLLGREYYAFDPELVLERQRCSAACWRFNNSTNPNTGVSVTERSRLFREILNPQEPIHLAPRLVSSTTRAGRVGQEVVVEAPFTCDYGYNITIGNNVMIGRNCTILDATEISIGDNVILSPNVTLLGATPFTDPKKRMGSKSPQIGGYIVIDDDVFIGAGAIIQHGIRIGRGASVSPGAVVVKVSCGSPPRKMSGNNCF